MATAPSPGCASPRATTWQWTSSSFRLGFGHETTSPVPPDSRSTSGAASLSTRRAGPRIPRSSPLASAQLPPDGCGGSSRPAIRWRGASPIASSEALIFPALAGAENGAATGVGALAGAATICSCNNVSKEAICTAIAQSGLTDVGGVKTATTAGTGCGGCVPLVTELLKAELKTAGVEVNNHVCEHFASSRQELFDIVRVHRV